MKTVAILAIAATTLVGGSALAFEENMVDYPRNVVVEEHVPAHTRAEVKANLVAHMDRNTTTEVSYPSAYVNGPADAPMLSRTEVRQELTHVVGDHFRSGSNTIESSPYSEG